MCLHSAPLAGSLNVTGHFSDTLIDTSLMHTIIKIHFSAVKTTERTCNRNSDSKHLVSNAHAMWSYHAMQTP